jgi:hypothetical protein
MGCREEMAWAAGFVDGEGSFFLCLEKRTSPRYPTFSLTQIDPQVLQRFAAAVGFGTVLGPYGPYSHGPKARPLYYYNVGGFQKTQAVMAMLWAWLGPVKREQAKRVLYSQLESA